MPEDGGVGRLRILAKGLAYIARLSIHGSGRRQELAGELLGQILRAAQPKGGDAYRRVKKAVDAGMTRGGFLKPADQAKTITGYQPNGRHVKTLPAANSHKG